MDRVGRVGRVGRVKKGDLAARVRRVDPAGRVRRVDPAAREARAGKRFQLRRTVEGKSVLSPSVASKRAARGRPTTPLATHCSSVAYCSSQRRRVRRRPRGIVVGRRGTTLAGGTRQAVAGTTETTACLVSAFHRPTSSRHHRTIWGGVIRPLGRLI